MERQGFPPWLRNQDSMAAMSFPRPLPGSRSELEGPDSSDFFSFFRLGQKNTSKQRTWNFMVILESFSARKKLGCLCSKYISTLICKLDSWTYYLQVLPSLQLKKNRLRNWMLGRRLLFPFGMASSWQVLLLTEEILHQLVDSLSHLFTTGFRHTRLLGMGCLNHQEYVSFREWTPLKTNGWIPKRMVWKMYF